MRGLEMILATALATGGCQPAESTDNRTRHLAQDEIELLHCLEKRGRFSECVELTPPQRIHGVWYTGFEESGFIPDVTNVPLTRTSASAASELRPRPEFRTALDIDASEALRQIGLPEVHRCPRAIAIEFIGRRTAKPRRIGLADHVVVVDKLLSGKLLGIVRTKGLPGYDEQCATPQPSEAEIRAMDEADLKRLEQSGHFIPIEKLQDRPKDE